MDELTRQACADGEGGSLRHELKFEEINGPTYLLQLDVSLIISEISNYTNTFNIEHFHTMQKFLNSLCFLLYFVNCVFFYHLIKFGLKI